MWVRLAALCTCVGLASCASEEWNRAWLAENRARAGWAETASGLQYRIVASGPPSGAHPNVSEPCACHYEGRLAADWPDGPAFDSSLKRGGAPATFAREQLIRGWDEALSMMRAGDVWEVAIPPRLGYGRRSAGRVPANSVLVFRLEFVALKPSTFWADARFAGKIAFLALGTAFWAFNTFCGSRYGSGMASRAGPKRVPLEAARGPDAKGARSNPVVFLDVAVGGEPVGRVEIELFARVCPRTAEHFRRLAAGDGLGPRRTLRGAPVRALADEIGVADAARGGARAYGLAPELDGGYVSHDRAFLATSYEAGGFSLTLAPRAARVARPPGTRRTRARPFFVSRRCARRDSKHVVFGCVTRGHHVLKAVAAASAGGRRAAAASVAECGECPRVASTTRSL